ncbi:lysosomal acid phosphatase-like protein [Dinothrombium tinctorium]|uniref:acid phosphatase n=1 Tax=Dinothrombium tinctorium TaxID=1965070 RepID=A0A3S3PPY8_9ACAR|nr:lysosomal acid phosphatase-like protein [Dinothrombium tinctorium]RWS06615.1 lysosomal acid phosphatase-like protein [Dinothrombium tinctorium]RWS06635.1 lysosomal acid phosphatase-like protein [Dinothrombium tinctorium]
MYKVGQQLRRMYENFLTGNPSEVFARSEDTPVTIESALTLLAGLYPPEGDRIWNENLLWQPIVVHTQPIESDNILSAYTSCYVADEEKKRILSSEYCIEIARQKSDFLRNVSRDSGVSIANLEDARRVYETLFAEMAEGFRLLEWVTSDVMQELQELSDLYYAMVSNSPIIQRLRAGPLLKEMRKKFNSALNSNSNTKFDLYSTQAQIIAPLLSALRVFNNVTLPIPSVLLFELHATSNNTHNVKIQFYNGTDGNYTHILRLPECEFNEMCPLAKFFSIIDRIIPNDWQAECRARLTLKKATLKSGFLDYINI